MATLIGHLNKIKWIAQKWKENGKGEELELFDELGFTPLISCCYRGYYGASDKKEEPDVKSNRLEVAKFLIEECGAKTNI